MKQLAYSRVVHLSQIIDRHIPLWPGDPAVEFETIAEQSIHGYYLRRFSMGEHSGTHLNAPRSFHAEGWTIDQYPAEDLVVPAVVIDTYAQSQADPDYELTIADLLHWEQQYGPVPAGSLVLMYTGWQARWQQPQDFMNLDSQGRSHFPGFGAAALDLLLQRQVAGIGIDTHGVDPGQAAHFLINTQMLEQPRLVLENLTNLDQLPPIGATLVIGILRLRGGSGSPAAVLALVP